MTAAIDEVMEALSAGPPQPLAQVLLHCALERRGEPEQLSGLLVALLRALALPVRTVW